MFSSTPHLESANFRYLAQTPDGRFWLRPVADSDIEDFTNNMISETRTRLAQVQHNEQGLRLDKMAGFLERFGLTTKPFVAVEAEGQQEIQEIMEISTAGKEGEVHGSYNPLVDFTYVLRGEAERVNGPEITEATAIHELSHSNQNYFDIVLYVEGKDGEKRPFNGLQRSGFTVGAWAEEAEGEYFEEGFAALMEHGYTREELGKVHGFVDRESPQSIVGMQGLPFGKKYLLPSSYLTAHPSSILPDWSASAHAAYGMQLLIAKDAQIFSAMLHARTEPAGLREFAQRIEVIQPGLYKTLQEAPYTEQGFITATSHIIQQLYDGNYQRAVAAAENTQLSS